MNTQRFSLGPPGQDWAMRHGWLAAGLLLCALGLPAPAMAADEHPEVRLTTLDWAPYVGESLPGQGFISQVIRTAFERAGLQAVIEFWPWRRAVERARNGTALGVFPEYYDAAREKDFIFSDPIPGGPIGLYRRKEQDIRYLVDPRHQPETAMRALRDYRFGLVRGYVNTREIDYADYLQRDFATSDAINLKKLAYGRVDLVVIDRYVAEYLLAGELREFAGQLVFMEPALEVKQLHLSFSRAHPRGAVYCELFNRALAAMREDGTLAALLARPPSSPR